MKLIEVNQDRCSKCGICTKVCPASVLVMGKNGPEALEPQACIACGHCVAICPDEAIDNFKTPLEKQAELIEFPVLDRKTAQQFLRSRRSIRCYKNKSVPDEELLQLVDIARFAPTGSNQQGVSYRIVKDQNTLKKAIEVTIDWMEGQAENPLYKRFSNYVRVYRENGIDTIFRGAPHLILATTKKDFPRGRENAIFSFTYLELFAPALGLGSCWAGLFEKCAFSDHSPLLELFNMPKDMVISGAVMVGYPQYSYKRLVDRNPLDVTWI